MLAALVGSSVLVVHCRVAGCSRLAAGDTVLEWVHHSPAGEVPHTAAAAEEDRLAAVGSLAEEGSLAGEDSFAGEDTAAVVAARHMTVALWGTAVEVPHILLHMAVGQQEERRRQVVGEGTGSGERRMLAVEEGSLLPEGDTAVGRMAVERNLEFVSSAHSRMLQFQLTSRRGAVLVVALIGWLV